MRAFASAFSALLVSVFVLSGCSGGADARYRVDAGPTDDDAAVDGGTDARTECSDPLPPPSQCDFFLSCGCDVANGEKCSLEAENGVRACFQAGEKQPGALCSDETECEAVSLCAIFGGSGEKHCMQYCDDDHGCPSAQACYVPVLNVADAFVCGQVCDLRNQDCAVAGQGCYPSSRVSTDEKGICANAADGETGDACQQGNDCAAGFICADTDGECHEICDRQDGDPGCTTGTCKPLEGHTVTGFCDL